MHPAASTSSTETANQSRTRRELKWSSVFITDSFRRVLYRTDQDVAIAFCPGDGSIGAPLVFVAGWRVVVEGPRDEAGIPIDFHEADMAVDASDQVLYVVDSP